MNHASFVSRFLAWLLDHLISSLIIIVFMVIFTGFFGITAGSDSRLLNILSAASLILILVILIMSYFIYFGLLWSKTGQTLRMRLLKIKVIYQAGGKLSFFRAALRGTLGYWLSGLIIGLGYIWAAFDSNHQAWHDKIFNTWVVRS